MIGIIGALDEEVDEICGNLEGEKVLVKAGYHYYSGRLNGRDVTLVKCGVGKVNAAICSQILIDTFGCHQIIFGGVAGALLPGLRQGDVVISSHVVQFDIDLTAFGRRRGELADKDRLIEADPAMVQKATEAFDTVVQGLTTPPTLMVGTIVSGDSFVSDPATIKWLQREFGAACTEMEGGPVGYTSMINDIPFVIIRVISDDAGSNAVEEFDTFLSRSSIFLYKIISTTIALL